MEDRARPRSPADQNLLDADRSLLAQIRAGDVEAGHRFVREHYAAIYRYLLHLTRPPDVAEDLTQETFLQGWRRLETFRARGSLRGWLYRIAHREFLHLLQRRHAEPGLDTMAELAAPDAAAKLDSVELRAVIDRLALEQREVVLLYYLEGYTSTEIARIVEAPVGTVCSRLARAREHLRQELGEDDLAYLNESLAPGTRAAGGRQWTWLPPDQMRALETRLTLEPRSEVTKEESMERREFLRQAAAGAAGLMLSETEKEVVDSRLTQKVTCAFMGTALADLCEKLKSDTGIRVTAGPSVADEKVTLFCEKLPLREVMRQLSRPFGYTWLRSGKAGDYRYELVQDLRSQLLEEELRSRDRHAALLALEKEIERYRPYLNLTPDEAHAQAQTAPPAEKKLFETLSGPEWGALQMYSRLSRDDFATMRAGEYVYFSGDPLPGQQQIPPDVERGMIQVFRDSAVAKAGDHYKIASDVPAAEPVPLAQAPGVYAGVGLTIQQRELGQMTLGSYAFWGLKGNGEKQAFGGTQGTYDHSIFGMSPTVMKPDNGALNTRFEGEPALRSRVTLELEGKHPAAVDSSPTAAAGPAPAEKKVTTAEALELLHRATGMPIVADFYTRLHQPAALSVRNELLFEALNQLSDGMRLRWNRDGDWLQFRSTSYYDDRLKEIPNRLLARWASSRREHGALTLDDLVEIAQLPDAPLDATEMAEGARDIWGLTEEELAQNRNLRRNLRFLAGFTPAQRQEARSAAGLPFVKMPLAQQQQFLAIGFDARDESLGSLDELAGATLRVDYSVPGGFQWGDPRHPGAGSFTRWVVPLEPGIRGRRVPRPPVRGETREAALRAVRQVNPQLRQSLLEAMRRADPRLEAAPHVVEEDQIFPTQLDLTFVYIPGTSSPRPLLIQNLFAQGHARPPL